MNDIKSCTYLMAYATTDSERKEIAMKPTAENIANFIMQNREASIMITDELDREMITAEYGFINRCVDQNFLLQELHPVIIPIQRGQRKVGEVEEIDLNPPEDDADLEL